MTYEEAQAELRNLGQIKIQLKRLADKILKDESSIIGKIGNYSGMVGTPNPDSNQKQMDKHVDLTRQYKAMFDDYNKRVLLTESKLVKLSLEDMRAANILSMYYVDGISIEQICVTMTYNWRHIMRLKSEAIEKYAKIKD